jgi:hypothetical protein
MGVGMIVALLVDAIVVRVLLVPAIVSQSSGELPGGGKQPSAGIRKSPHFQGIANGHHMSDAGSV